MNGQRPGSTFSHRDRLHNLEEMSKQEFDLVIIGGGITGAGAARDAASRGMKVALIEARDFAEGTSSRSSKLIHGGIRYLENFEFHLVFEALSERRLLFDMAPHLVHPLRFVLPLYKGGRVGMFKMGLGMWLYDALSMFEAPESHERLDVSESLERLPLLRPDGLLGSYVYSDAYMDDDRLVIETLRSAARLGAVCANRVAAVSARIEEGKIRAVGCEDRLSGRRFEIRARHVISSVGPWTDIVASKLLGGWRKLLRPSKGVHLTFARDRLHLKQAVVMAADKQKRIVFGIPRHEMIIIGTTDTDFPDDPESVVASPEDVRYLLAVAKEYFPGAGLTVDDIISTYSGVRPLVDDGAETESKTSREHVIITDPRNITFVAGGKYTTYRLMAEQTVRAALETFPLEDRVRFNLNETKSALNPLASPEKMDIARAQTKVWAKESGMSSADVSFLVERHGEEASLMLSRALQGETSSQRMWSAEIHHAIQHTMCLELVDFFTRRSPLFLATPDHGLSLLPHLANVMASELNWSDQQRQEQINRVHQHIAKELHWKQSFGISATKF